MCSSIVRHRLARIPPLGAVLPKETPSALPLFSGPRDQPRARIRLLVVLCWGAKQSHGALGPVGG